MSINRARMNKDHCLTIAALIRDLEVLLKYLQPIKDKLREHYPDLRYLPIVEGLIDSVERFNKDVLPHYGSEARYKWHMQQLADYMHNIVKEDKNG